MIKLFKQSIGRLRLTKTKISICGLAASAAVISMLALAAAPARAAEPLLVAAIHVSQVEVCWNSTSNLTYQVQYRSDLTTNLWTSLVDCVLGNGSVKCLSYPGVVGEPQRFYRVVETNCVPSPEATLILEVACDGRTSALNRVDPSSTNAAGRGDVGIVNGFIFPLQAPFLQAITHSIWTCLPGSAIGFALTAARLFLLREAALSPTTSRCPISRQRG